MCRLYASTSWGLYTGGYIQQLRASVLAYLNLSLGLVTAAGPWLLQSRVVLPC